MIGNWYIVNRFNGKRKIISVCCLDEYYSVLYRYSNIRTKKTFRPVYDLMFIPDCDFD